MLNKGRYSENKYKIIRKLVSYFKQMWIEFGCADPKEMMDITPVTLEQPPLLHLQTLRRSRLRSYRQTQHTCGHTIYFSHTHLSQIYSNNITRTWMTAVAVQSRFLVLKSASKYNRKRKFNCYQRDCIKIIAIIVTRRK